MPINLDKYFERIQYIGDHYPSVDTLRALHLAQAMHIPFENLQMHEEQHAYISESFIKLDEQSLFDKLIVNRRGGYCHENNELLALVLDQLGFKIDRLSARVLLTDNLPPLHKLLAVHIDGQIWIADVGFASYSFLEPILLKLDNVVEQYGSCYKISMENNKYILQILIHEQWKSLYEFSLEPRKAIDFEPMNYYVSHSPGFLFYHNKIVSKPTKTGRIILHNHQLKIISNTYEENYYVNDGEYYEVLKIYFDIHINKVTTLKPISSQQIEKQRRESHVWCRAFYHSEQTTNALISNENIMTPSFTS